MNGIENITRRIGEETQIEIDEIMKKPMNSARL